MERRAFCCGVKVEKAKATELQKEVAKSNDYRVELSNIKTQIAQTEMALQAWSDVANITFARAGAGASGPGAYSNDATILLGNYASGFGSSAAFALFRAI